jgi:hypothetical protein
MAKLAVVTRMVKRRPPPEVDAFRSPFRSPGLVCHILQAHPVDLRRCVAFQACPVCYGRTTRICAWKVADCCLCSRGREGVPVVTGRLFLGRICRRTLTIVRLRRFVVLCCGCFSVRTCRSAGHVWLGLDAASMLFAGGASRSCQSLTVWRSLTPHQQSL